jgi:hypothetical protein
MMDSHIDVFPFRIILETLPSSVQGAPPFSEALARMH